MGSRNKAEKILDFAEANMRFEGFHVSESLRVECKGILKKECTAEEIVRLKIEKYSKGKD